MPHWGQRLNVNTIIVMGSISIVTGDDILILNKNSAKKKLIKCKLDSRILPYLPYYYFRILSKREVQPSIMNFIHIIHIVITNLSFVYGLHIHIQFCFQFNRLNAGIVEFLNI